MSSWSFLRQQQGGGGVCSMGVNNSTSFLQGTCPIYKQELPPSKHPECTRDNHLQAAETSQITLCQPPSRFLLSLSARSQGPIVAPSPDQTLCWDNNSRQTPCMLGKSTREHCLRNPGYSWVTLQKSSWTKLKPPLVKTKLKTQTLAM